MIYSIIPTFFPTFSRATGRPSKHFAYRNSHLHLVRANTVVQHSKGSPSSRYEWNVDQYFLNSVGRYLAEYSEASPPENTYKDFKPTIVHSVVLSTYLLCDNTISIWF